MGKTQDPEPGARADGPQDLEVTGTLPMSLTSFVGRERELDELRSLFRAGKRLVTLVGIGGGGHRSDPRHQTIRRRWTGVTSSSLVGSVSERFLLLSRRRR